MQGRKAQLNGARDGSLQIKILQRRFGMSVKTAKSSILKTGFDEYVLGRQIGAGGAGRVLEGTDSDGKIVAIKLLSQNTTSDSRKRFKNETAFLRKNTHRNIITVIDHGHSEHGPFYVMPRYECSLRESIHQLTPESAFGVFAQICNGLEAAHLQKVVHRDLKPENILCDKAARDLVVADFGIAEFTGDLLYTSVETQDTKRLANFTYAAPEQRVRNRGVAIPADIFALGLILNELFTREVPHGTAYKTIGSAANDYAYLDAIVAKMLAQDPANRPASIEQLRTLIGGYRNEFLAHQRLNRLGTEVVPAQFPDEPLASEPPKLIEYELDDGYLILTVDRPLSQMYLWALKEMSTGSLYGYDPKQFIMMPGSQTVRIRCNDNANTVQAIINFFKGWLPQASTYLKTHLTNQAAQRQRELEAELRAKRETEERKLAIYQTVRI